VGVEDAGNRGTGLYVTIEVNGKRRVDKCEADGWADGCWLDGLSNDVLQAKLRAAGALIGCLSCDFFSWSVRGRAWHTGLII
jgi:hypothetical protein